MSIQRAGDRWHVVVTIPRAQRAAWGRSQLRRVARSHADAVALQAALVAEVRRGRGDARARTLGDALRDWLNGEARTLRSYEHTRRHARAIRALIEHRPVIEAGAVVADIRAHGAAHGWRRGTTYQRCAIVRRLARLAVEWGWLDHVPPLRMPPPSDARDVHLEAAQVEALADAAGRSRPVVLLLAYSGLRAGELWHPDARIRHGAIEVPAGKNGRPRTVPVPLDIAALPVPPQVTRRQFRADFERARQAIGMPGLRIHDLRHTYASLLLASGADLVDVRDLLGHSHLGVTSRYSHRTPERLRRAVGRVR